MKRQRGKKKLGRKRIRGKLKKYLEDLLYGFKRLRILLGRQAASGYFEWRSPKSFPISQKGEKIGRRKGKRKRGNKKYLEDLLYSFKHLGILLGRQAASRQFEWRSPKSFPFSQKGEEIGRRKMGKKNWEEKELEEN
jgi:hypothetical protein